MGDAGGEPPFLGRGKRGSPVKRKEIVNRYHGGDSGRYMTKEVGGAMIENVD
jgi:hypothetical protein